jgi:molybdate transport system permease protein
MTQSDISAVGLSLSVSAAAVALIAAPGVLLALWLSRSRRWWKGIVETVVLVPLVLPPVVIGIGLLVAVGWLRLNIAFTWWAAVLASAVVASPLLVRTVRAALDAEDPRLAQVAATLGATRARIFFTVTLPAVWPAVVGGLVLAWARALGEFGATLIVAGNIAGRTRTIPLAMYTDWQAADRPVWPLAGVSVGLALAAVMLAEWLMRRTRTRRADAHDSNLQAA